ncbi:hypothetical protein [Streptomyces sp. NPDC058326]|uniref:hypothetical protein n=1 Tax=Streptomyces sp. NPDC058326 TaxID=3346447 RepID=UPI0036EEC7F4
MGSSWWGGPRAACGNENEGALGLDAPDGDEDLRDVVEADAEQVFTDWRFR